MADEYRKWLFGEKWPPCDSGSDPEGEKPQALSGEASAERRRETGASPEMIPTPISLNQTPLDDEGGRVCQ